MPLPVDVAELVRELVCAGPADSDEHVEEAHERLVAIGFAQEWSELREVTFNDFDDESFGELLVLVARFAAGSDGVADEEEHTGRVDVDKVLEGVHEVLRCVWVPEGREKSEERFGVRVELLGG